MTVIQALAVGSSCGALTQSGKEPVPWSVGVACGLMWYYPVGRRRQGKRDRVLGLPVKSRSGDLQLCWI